MISKNKKKQNTTCSIAENRQARHHYFIENSLEAGLVLEGWEVKSLRSGQVQLKESYISLQEDKLFLVSAHISPKNTASTHVQPDPIRRRLLLVHKKEIAFLKNKVEEKGYTLIPLDLHWKNTYAKVLVGIAKGKKQFDKRHTLKEKTIIRETARELKNGIIK